MRAMAYASKPVADIAGERYPSYRHFSPPHTTCRQVGDVIAISVRRGEIDTIRTAEACGLFTKTDRQQPARSKCCYFAISAAARSAPSMTRRILPLQI